jgi:polysaccharide deacetylase family protein (PEP-CTERM system associated)
MPRPPTATCTDTGSDLPQSDRHGVPIRNAFTVDVEDYYQVSAFERDIPRETWDAHEQRVADNTQRILALLKRCGVRGTFFVLGWVAERFPQLVEKIHRQGHEIASHGFWHRLVYQQTPEQFRNDLRRSLDAIRTATGLPVTGYRAPSFSITAASEWALDILIDEGIEFDSSIFPIHHDRYGIPGAPRWPYRVKRQRGGLWEFPPTVARFAGLNIPVGGGGYFRLYPLAWTLRMLRRINRKEQRAFVVYVHPWEIDPQQPRLGAGSRLARWRHHVGIATTERKLEMLLGQFMFGTVTDVLRQPSPVKTG